jgi:hypothetical protein
LEAQDPLAGAGTAEIFDMKGLLGSERHPEILAVRPCAIVTSLLILGRAGASVKSAPGVGWAENRDSMDCARAGVGAASPITIT